MNQLDLSVVNSMLMKQKANEVQVDEILSWATRFEDAGGENLPEKSTRICYHQSRKACPDFTKKL